jgi:hypothetical protein
MKFHCGYCGRDGHKDEFCFKRKHEERMAREWANKDRYHPCNGVPEPRMPMHRAKVFVRTVPAWRDRKVAGGAAGQATPVRLVQVWTDNDLIFVLVRMLNLVQVVVVLVVGMESMQVVSLLDGLHLVLNMRVGGVVALRWRGGTVHSLSFIAFVLLQRDKGGSLVVVFVVVALVGEMLWFVLTPLWSKWLDTDFTLLVLTLVLSCLFTHMLAFEFQVGDLECLVD